MSALTQGLMLASAAKATPPPPAPPEASGAAAPAAAAAGAAPSHTPPGALGQAMNILAEARKAVAADPMQAKAVEAMDQDAAARAQAAKALEANMGKVQELQAQPDPAHVEVPRLHELPKAPEPEHKDPLRVFGQLLPVVAALGALTTKQPAINALNAATAMVNAARANDKEEEAKQRQAWVDNLNLTVQNNNQILTDYKLALEDRNATVTERMAKVYALAAQNRDYVTLAALKGGNLDSLTNYLRVQATATGQLADLATTLTEQQLQRARLEQQSMYQFAQLELERRRLAQVSMGDAIGPVLLKIQQANPELAAQGLDKVLNAGEIQALKLYMDINRQAAYSDRPGSQPAGGGLGGLVAPAAAGATAAPTAAPATGPPPRRPGSVAPPAGILKPGQITYLSPGAGLPAEAWKLTDGKPQYVGPAPEK